MAEKEDSKSVQKPHLEVQGGAPKPAHEGPADPRIPVPDFARKAEPPQEMDPRAAQAREAVQARAEAAEEAKAAAVVKHVWTSEDTYSSLAFKYYGSIKEPYWRLIYEHNKAIIGNHPNDIRVGLEIEIPPLPEALKKK